MSKNITTRKSKLVIGSMDRRIQIQKRIVLYRNSANSYSFETVYTVWANRETLDGFQKFNGININDVTSDRFKIRKISDLTSEYFILDENQRFRILKVDDANKGSHQIVHCRDLGLSTLEGSKS